MDNSGKNINSNIQKITENAEGRIEQHRERVDADIANCKADIERKIEKQKENINCAICERDRAREELYKELQSGERFSSMFGPESGIDRPTVSLKRFKKVSSILEIICRITSYAMGAMIIVCLVMLLLICFSDKAADTLLGYESVVENNALVVGAIEKYAMSKYNMTPRVGAIVELAASMLLLCAIGYVLQRGSYLLSIFKKGGQPFTRENAKEIHKLPFITAFFLLWNPVAGVAAILFTVALSSLYDYSVYLREQHDATKHIQEDVILSFAEITEARSGQTGKHVKRVAEYTYIMARQLSYTEEAAENLRYASMMHDVGKISIPLEILEKPGKLTDEEFEKIKTHTTEGERLLHNAKGEILQLGATVAFEHHEKWDGTGYPQKKSGTEISRAARIVAVADVFDALTSRRSYKNAWTNDDAYNEIVKCSGTQFDPEVVECFKQCYPKMLKVKEEFAD